MTWRTSDELLERVRRQAQEQGRSLNEWVTAVLSAASDPASAGDEAQQLRERLVRAGVLDDVEPPVARPAAKRVAAARAAASRGRSLAGVVSDDRR